MKTILLKSFITLVACLAIVGIAYLINHGERDGAIEFMVGFALAVSVSNFVSKFYE